MKSKVEQDQGLLRVGGLAKTSGKTVRALHLYEQLGLLTPASRSAGGYRLYGPEALTRVSWIVKLQDMGFSLAEIQGFVRGFADAKNGPSGMGRAREVFERKLRQTRETIERLRVLERDLQASLSYLESCTACDARRVASDCAVCAEHGHVPAETPSLVAGLAKPARPTAVPWDVPLGHLTEGTR